MKRPKLLLFVIPILLDFASSCGQIDVVGFNDYGFVPQSDNLLNTRHKRQVKNVLDSRKACKSDDEQPEQR